MVARGSSLIAGYERWVRDHLSEQFLIATAARELGVTERSLQRAPRAALGMSPKDFADDIRLDRATRLLRSGGLTVGSVAREVGCLNASALRTLARRRRGLSLAEIRTHRLPWEGDSSGSGGGARGDPYTVRMSVRRLIAALLLSAAASLGISACTTTGPGARSECEVSGCTVTFERGVQAKISVLGVDTELTSVQGDLVTLSVAGQPVTVPMGESGSVQGLNLTVQEVTQDTVVVRLATGL
ncbi:AraC family transcriptional regulator [Nocardia sp. NPDC050799]|uniref:AraC family transcriptional regulator n=1 Tax=Nocardia sp. NPDC050799 TaxID=3154842 RepID=UPI0033C79A70